MFLSCINDEAKSYLYIERKKEKMINIFHYNLLDQEYHIL